MQPSDWIAIAALTASVIISIAGFWFNYRTNKENIKARRANLVAEKSIEAYREIVEQLEYIEFLFVEQKDDQAVMSMDEFETTYRKYRVYLSSEIAEDIDYLLDDWMRSSSGLGDVDGKAFQHSLAEKREIVKRIQRHLGVETKEEGKK